MGIIEKNGKFYPDETFTSQALLNTYDQYREIYDRSVSDPEGFWKEVADELVWFDPPKTVLNYNFDITKGKVFHEWFKGGYTNMSYNCLDRHINEGNGDKIALIWQGESIDMKKEFTYKALHQEVCRFANVLKKKGLKKGDRVSIYMPMVWQLPVAMLACTRLGLPHSVVFGGFSADALMHRIQESESKLLITVDESVRGGKTINLKESADKALTRCPSIEQVIVVKRTGCDINWVENRDSYWQDEMVADDISDHCECEHMEAEDILFILYTSGSTGKPKGQVHTTGGYMTYVYLTQKWIFDLKPDTVYWCIADIGWITGHSYIVYGPLLNGITTFLYEGTPLFPEPDIAWKLIDNYRINICYTAPTAIRALSRQGESWTENNDLSSLRLLGSVGEPINPEAWLWYHRNIGKERCPIVDTWWQTETGGIMIAPIPGVAPTKPGSAQFPFPGVVPRIADPGVSDFNNRGEKLGPNETGHLCIEKPWPGLSRTIFKDHDRWERTYFSQYPNMYFTGDGCLVDDEGYHFLQGRVDDVINISGHRISTAEVESALVHHKSVAEAAAAAMPNDIKGQSIYVFVTLKLCETPSEELKQELVDHVRKEIGAIATPEKLQFTSSLPKTRSGKIMRRILRKIAENNISDLGDVSTLEDAGVIRDLIDNRV